MIYFIGRIKRKNIFRSEGLMASGQAAQAGPGILLLEKMRRTGLKLCITGKGRCNITNIVGISHNRREKLKKKSGLWKTAR
ncbi:MAG: NAD(P)/FAD-dependent oxidoreductase [Proteobacteria bacterium]|nr:NAD(P)/FAD-dependent oxidoreductase [Pseudomonadota bacterium]